MKIGVIIICSIFYIYTAYHTYRFTRAELDFRIAVAYVGACGGGGHIQLCMRAGELLQSAILWKPEEFFFRYNMFGILLILSNKLKDPRLLQSALKHLDKAEVYAWDKHYIHIGRANVFSQHGQYKEAIKEVNKALVYIPHNRKLLKIKAELEAK